jgi:hypothetical protein
MPSVRLRTTLVAMCILAGCATQDRRDPHTITKTSSAGAVEGRPTLGRAIPVPGQPTVLVPFAVESVKGLFEKDDPYRRSTLYSTVDRSVAGYAFEQPYAQDVRWHNAIFRDLHTGDEWVLLSRRGIISRYEPILQARERDKPPVARALLFTAVLDDTNHDGLLDDLDARVAILTDADGRHPRVVTPPDAQVWSAAYDPQKDIILLYIARDTTGNGRFDTEDEPAPYWVDAGGNGPARPIVGAGSLAAVRSLLAIRPPNAPTAAPAPATEPAAAPPAVHSP